MAGLIGIDCTAQLTLRSGYFPCELPYLHDESEHQCTLIGEEQQINLYGCFRRAPVRTVLRWPAVHDSYAFHDKDGAVVPRDEKAIAEKYGVGGAAFGGRKA